jgi:hypothetical protein
MGFNRIRNSVLACGLAFMATTARAQVGAGQVAGLVTAADGARVPGASIVVTHVATAVSRETVSNPQGAYVMPSLPPGTYRVDIALAGFRPLRRDDVRVETGSTVRLDFELTVGGGGESVTVVAGTPVLRDAAGLGQVVSEGKIVGLPLNGRNFITLASLVPGVALPPPHVSQLPRINGGRPRTNEYLFDGISVLQPEPGQVAFFPIIDAIQEFKIETNSPPAEFGRFNGGVINLTTRSGTNTWHGSVFGFQRHEGLNARNYFAMTGPKPEYRRNQSGFVLGGPIQRSRTFFFTDYQGQRQRIGRTLISTVPTLLQRRGIFTEPIAGVVPAIYDPATTVPNGSGGFTRTPFAGGMIAPEKIDPIALALLQRYPEPTSPGTGSNYRRTVNEADDQDQWDVRIDHRFPSERDQAFVRLSHFRGRFKPAVPLPDGSGTVSAGTLATGPQDTTAWALAANYQRTISATIVNEVRFGDTRRAIDRTAAELGGAGGSALNIPGIPSFARFPDTLPTFLITGYQQLGSPQFTASDFNTSVSEVADTFTWLKGRHTLKGGFDWRWERLDVVQPPSPTGQFTFNRLGSDLPGAGTTGTPFASFLLGQVQSFQIDLQTSEIQERARIQEYFIQDDWRVLSRLTINAGVRYTLNFPSTEINGQTAVFNLQTKRLEYPGDEPVRRLHKDNFGPRVGAAYRLTDRALVSAGYGRIYIEMAGITTPFTTPTFPFLQTVTQRSLNSVTPAFALRDGPSVVPIEPTPTAGFGQGVFSVTRDLGSGFAQQWNVSLQRELTRNTNIEVAYVGSTITRVGLPDSNLNQLTVEQLAIGTPLLALVPNPFFGTIPRSSSLGDPTISVAQLMKPFPEYTTVALYRNNTGTQNYHGLTLKFQQRYARGLSYLISYTRSRLMDDAGSVFDPGILTGPQATFQVADSFDQARERDYSTGDIPHLFVASTAWDVPIGAGRAVALRGVLGTLASDWSVSAIVTLQSGSPVAVTQTNSNAFAGFGTQRPNLIGDPRLDERTPARWFNTNAFALAPQFTLGSASRNPVRGPSYRNVDLVVSRRVPVSRGAAVEIRLEAFNLLNTPPFGNPGGTFGTATFGAITSAGDPRVVQLAAKLMF